MIKRMMALALSLMLVLTACGGDSKKASEDGERKLTIYSNSLTSGRNEWMSKKAKDELDMDLEFVDAGGGDIFNRVLAEKGSPIADIVFGLDESMFFQLKDEDILVEYEPSWVKDVPEEAVIGDGYFYPLVEQRIFMIYNPEFVDVADVPEKWEDLATMENYQGKYRVPSDLAGGTNQKSVLSILLQYQDENGELDISQEGWDQVEAFLANGYKTPESENQDQNFKDGKVPISFTYISNVPKIEEEYGFKAEVINPSYGVITMREEIGIVNKGEDTKKELCQEFIDWFGSGEVQGEWAKEFGSLPVNEEALEKGAHERVKEIAKNTTPMNVDWNFVREHLSDWIEKVELDLY
ncbi:MAG: extracellular solute-binding protein [Tissierellia bacterium]|nr:extracellular solute-binding protein [Tissierellia bacterium]